MFCGWINFRGASQYEFGGWMTMAKRKLTGFLCNVRQDDFIAVPGQGILYNFRLIRNGLVASGKATTTHTPICWSYGRECCYLPIAIL